MALRAALGGVSGVPHVGAGASEGRGGEEAGAPTRDVRGRAETGEGKRKLGRGAILCLMNAAARCSHLSSSLLPAPTPAERAAHDLCFYLGE